MDDIEKKLRDAEDKFMRTIIEANVSKIREDQAKQKEMLAMWEANPKDLTKQRQDAIVTILTRALSEMTKMQEMATEMGSDEIKQLVEDHLKWSAEALSRIKAINSTQSMAN